MKTTENKSKGDSANTAAITTDHTNRAIRSNVIPVARILITVVVKFTAPRIEDTPAK